MQRRRAAQVAVEGRGELSHFRVVQGACPGAAKHAHDGVGVAGLRFEHAALDAVESPDPQQEIVEILAAADEGAVEVAVARDPIARAPMVQEPAARGDRAIIRVVERFPALVRAGAGEVLRSAVARSRTRNARSRRRSRRRAPSRPWARFRRRPRPHREVRTRARPLLRAYSSPPVGYMPILIAIIG
jgi:hypothetical protein